ncbi:MAG TPA: PqqD family peptide modification chaperone [archaeon]|nr:PqqD family peptide modification chaperone [archaeon]
MAEERFKKKGVVTQAEDGSFVIVDDEKKGYNVDAIVAVVWLKADNKTFAELVDDIAGYVKNVERKVVKEGVETIVTDLKKVKLLE